MIFVFLCLTFHLVLYSLGPSMLPKTALFCTYLWLSSILVCVYTYIYVCVCVRLYPFIWTQVASIPWEL